MKLQVKALHTFVEHYLPEDPKDTVPLRKVAIVAVVKNPYAGQDVEDLSEAVEASRALGEQMGKLATQAMGDYPTVSYGKGGIVGLNGEQEHLAAMLTTTFAGPLRDVLGGGKAWISSFTKRGAPGTSIDIPLAHKDALYVRSHYDGMTVVVPDGPQADDCAIIFCIANRGRLRARVGGLDARDIKGLDGLV